MKQLTFFLTIFIVTCSLRAFACDCDSQGEFLTVAPRMKLVSLIKINRYLTFKDINDKPTPMSMEVEIIENYKGQETRNIITVWGDNGALCRPYLSRFDIGKYYVIAFDKSSDISEVNANKTEKKTDYSISICGDYWLSVDFKKQIATGPVSNKQAKIRLTDLRKRLLE